MRPATIEKWLVENADAPPPPATPTCLPDDTVSTVYPESSVSNPYASRYTGTRHRSPIFVSRSTSPPQAYLERRPTSAQAHYRDHHQTNYVPPPTSRNRHYSFSADARYIPTQPQPFAYGYTKPQANQSYYTPTSTHHMRSHSSSRDVPHRSHSPPLYRVVSSSPKRVEVPRSPDSRKYGSYDVYHSTPTITLQGSRPKKPPFLRRLFGGLQDWGNMHGKSSSQPARNTSRSSSKSKSQSRASDPESTRRPSRGRSHSDGVIYVRY